MPHLVLMRDGEPVAEAEVSEVHAEAYAAAFPKPYVPQEYPKWVDGVIIHGPHEEPEEQAAPEPDAEAAEPESAQDPEPKE